MPISSTYHGSDTCKEKFTASTVQLLMRDKTYPKPRATEPQALLLPAELRVPFFAALTMHTMNASRSHVFPI